MELDAHGALLKRNSAAVAKLDSEVLHCPSIFVVLIDRSVYSCGTKHRSIYSCGTDRSLLKRNSAAVAKLDSEVLH